MAKNNERDTAASHHLSSGTLKVTDDRTNRSYSIPIRHNAILATDLKSISLQEEQTNRPDQADSGLCVLDPGMMNTAVIESQITYIDGKQGSIHYRDHSITELFENNDFEEVAHLLIWGHLPSSEEKTEFRKKLAAAAQAPATVANVIKSFPSDAPTCTMLQAGLSAFAASNPSTIPVHAGKNLYEGNNTEFVDHAIIRTLSAMCVVVALVSCHHRKIPFTPANPNFSYIENMLLMMGHVDPNTKRSSPKTTRSLNRLWILTADHSLTNSTACFLHVASTLADPLSCLVASLASGYGPLHAGAIDMSYKIFRDIGSPSNVPAFISKVKEKKSRLYGYGHRIYKTVDPRSKLTKTIMSDLSITTTEEKEEGLEKGKNQTPSLLAVALEIDRIASQDPYFTSRNLKTNADLYSCFVYTALGFDPSIIIALACTSRLPGVLAHWREAMGRKPPLWRPQQVYTGRRGRDSKL